jgi:hypothetical protein
MKKNTSPCMHTLSVTMMIALLSLLAIFMSACGSPATSTPGTSTGSSGGTNTPIATTPGLPKAGTGKVQNCGTIRVLSQGNTSNTHVAGNCFWQAYQKCQSALLVANFTGVDTITKRTLTVEPSTISHTTCHVTDVLQRAIVPRPLKTIGRYGCASISHTQQELTVKACGTDGDITIPLR